MGRNRSFDTQAAVTSAARLFWRGYEQTSLTELTEALGIAPASLYLAFDSKEALFRLTVERYVEFRDAAIDRAFSAPSAIDGVAAMLAAYVDVLCDDTHARGCLIVNNVLATANGSPLQRWLLRHRDAIREKLERRFLFDVEAGRLPADIDAPTMARFVGVLAAGLVIEARSGSSPELLKRMAELGVRSLRDQVDRHAAD